jgi:glycosyltransferase involved in cell wall biosynthesis
MSVIVPTLNEEENIRSFLNSIENQPSVDFETLIIDGGSRDRTSKIALQYNAKVIVLPGHGEFISRNIGAKMAKGDFLLFTCADTIFPKNAFRKIVDKFEKHPELVALTGPGHAYDAPLLGKVEYAIYDFIRYFFAKLPRPIKRFSTSTKFLVVRKDYFEKTKGFAIDDINADGLMGKELLNMGFVAFFPDVYIHNSGRRMNKMGFLDFNKHYLYALENFLFFASDKGAVKAWKLRAKKRHGKIHEI